MILLTINDFSNYQNGYLYSQKVLLTVNDSSNRQKFFQPSERGFFLTSKVLSTVKDSFNRVRKKNALRRPCLFISVLAELNWENEANKISRSGLD